MTGLNGKGVTWTQRQASTEGRLYEETQTDYQVKTGRYGDSTTGRGMSAVTRSRKRPGKTLLYKQA